MAERVRVDRGVAEGLQLEECVQRSLMMTANRIESVKVNFEKQEPMFADVE